MLNFVKISVAAILIIFHVSFSLHKHSSGSYGDCKVCIIYKVSSKFKEELSSSVERIATVIYTIEFKAGKFVYLAVIKAKSRDPPYQG